MRLLACALIVCGMTASVSAGEPLIIPVWPEGTLRPLSEEEYVIDRTKDPAKPDHVIGNVSEPTLTITWPEKVQGSAPAVLICPGGGYNRVVIDKEGHALAKWFNEQGFVAAVLKYRLPRVDVESPNVPWPIQDGQRALRLLRQNAAEWKIDPSRVGVVGSSAGGHLASTLATHWRDASDDKGDPLTHFSARPDFQILLYPVINFDDEKVAHLMSRTKLLGENPPKQLQERYSNEKRVDSETPPAFLVHARDDEGVLLENSERYHQALQKAGIPSELVVLETGGHGFGLGVNGGEPLKWPPLCAEWLKIHVLQKKSAQF